MPWLAWLCSFSRLTTYNGRSEGVKKAGAGETEGKEPTPKEHSPAETAALRRQKARQKAPPAKRN
ncbi:MAG: hypothetical protein MUC87_12955 [Bacteroidia bacterium]|nr:hypothetical protein [Bacteroidia bacterium]